jgi:hypothetical protein
MKLGSLFFFQFSFVAIPREARAQRPTRHGIREQKKKTGIGQSEITSERFFFLEVGDQSTFELAIGRELALHGRSLMADRAVCLINF